ncbi:MAG TPA: hypothetical protein VLC92_16295 [Rhodocyclaceae bacterium]|nr:hypothetical protein [Rhodocyclaceae bacterium]
MSTVIFPPPETVCHERMRRTTGYAISYGAAYTQTCPVCHELAYRIPRRFIDHIASLFSNSRRYQCRSFACNWVGNLKPYSERPDK